MVKMRKDEVVLNTSIIGRRSILGLIKGYPRGWIGPRPGPRSDGTRRYFEPAQGIPYAEEEARTRYLESKPVCLWLLGKPGLEGERIAEAIALARNCVLISAGRIAAQLREEDAQLDCGCDANDDRVWAAMLELVHGREVAHRGYVLEGLPLVRAAPKPTAKSSSSASSSEKSAPSTAGPVSSYTLLTLPGSQESNDTLCSSAPPEPPDEASDSERTVVASSSSSGSLVDSSSSQTELCECTSSVLCFECPKCSATYQIDQISNEWPLKPDIIVHLTCPDDEVMQKHEKPRCESASSVENAADKSDDQSGGNSSVRSVDRLYDEFSSCSLDNLRSQLENYAKQASKAIDKLIADFNPQNVMSVDGRYPAEHVFETIKVRLQILPLRVAVVPERIAREIDDSDEFANEGYESDSIDNSSGDDNPSLQRAFDEMRRDREADYESKLSRWKFLCPVELAKRRRTEGRKKFAVRFMNWIFFLSSSQAMEAFIENPRPYLLPPNPRPCCKIAVIGPRYSGKTGISSDLAGKLDGVVIDGGDVIDRLGASNFDGMTGNDGCHEIDRIVVNIVEAIEQLPENRCSDVRIDAGWILDGLCLNFELCKKLLENDICIDTVIFLFESEPYTTLLERWRKHQEVDSFENETSQSSKEGFEDDFETNVIRELESFNREMERIIPRLVDIGIRVVPCDLKYTNDVSECVNSQIWRDFQLIVKVAEKFDEEEEEEGEEEEFSHSDLNRRESNLGDCKNYCPVALKKHNILYKGRNKYRCLLDDKFYFMSSESALNDFLADYSKFDLPFKKSLDRIPPFKVSLVGPRGSGKTAMSELIAREYGLVHVNFLHRLNMYMINRNIDIKRLKMNQKDDEESQGSLEDFELPEDLDDPRYDTDNLVISKFFLKYDSEGNSLPTRVAEECLLKFFKPPFTKYGSIMDSFPNCIEDCELIEERFIVPDVIVALQCDLQDSENRLLKKMISKWKVEQDEQIKLEQIRFDKATKSYNEFRETWMSEQREIIIEERNLAMFDLEENSEESSTSSSVPVEEKNSSAPEEEKDSNATDNTFVTIDYDDERELQELFDKTFPKPELFTDWETEEAATIKFLMQIEDRYEKDMQHVSRIRQFFANKPVKFIELNARPNVHKVFTQLSYLLVPYVQRNSSFLENIIEVDHDAAENLLKSGIYFLSSFGRFCPVQLFQGANPFQMFIPLSSQKKIVPVLHRQFIYFLSGEEALAAFKNDPLKYLNQDPRMPMVPALISIIGPPKSGKSTLSQRFLSTYEFEVISRDEVIHYVLTNFPATILAASLRKTFQNDDSVSPEQFAEVVKLSMSNPRCIAQGCVFDGFPSSVDEFEAFSSIKIAPHVVIDLQVPLDFTIECLQQRHGFLLDECDHLETYEEWRRDADSFRLWLNDKLGNVAKIDGTKSKAAVWRFADSFVRQRYTGYLKYLRETGYDLVHDVEFVSIKSDEIKRGLSSFELYCPSCIANNQTFNCLDLSKSRKGLVQYRRRYYWFCEDHVGLFTREPERFMKVFDRVELPDHYPKLMSDRVDLDNQCWASRLVNRGYCIVAYVDNLPNRQLVPGSLCLGVLLSNKLYLFSSEGCRQKFVRHFPSYTRHEIHFTRTLAPMELKGLPLHGFLEQTVAALVAKAVSRVGLVRPKLPGLSPKASAAVFVGSYLKANRESAESRLYEAAVSKIEARCKLFRDAIDVMKVSVNPWAVVYRSEKDGEGEEADEEPTREKTPEENVIYARIRFMTTTPTPTSNATSEDSDIG